MTNAAVRKTSELIAPALDWAVAKCEGLQAYKDAMLDGRVKEGWWVSGLSTDPNDWHPLSTFNPSTNWAQGGPITEREKIDTIADPNGKDVWLGRLYQNRVEYKAFGPTPLVAAIRCLVVSKLGEYVEIPESLLWECK